MIFFVVKEHIGNIKNMAAEKKMYNLFLNLKRIEKELSSYKNMDLVSEIKFIELLQSCLVGLPETESILIKPIIRELKIKQILK
jgi:hypothetical protein